MASKWPLTLSLIFSFSFSSGLSEMFSKDQTHSKHHQYTSVRHADSMPSCIAGLDQLDERDCLIHHIPENSNVTYKLIILVESTRGEQWRAGIRETWGNFTSSDDALLLFAFPIGGTTVRTGLIEESKRHRDMIMFTHVTSSHYSSSRFVHYLHWVQKMFNFSFLLRTHDNYFVKIHKIMELLIPYYDRSNVELYMGYFCGTKEIDSNDDSWFLCPSYIVHAEEGGYMLSSGLIERFLKAKDYLNYYNKEGASIGLWSSPYKDVKFVHEISFDTSLTTSRGCLNSYSITPITTLSQMRRMYNVYESHGHRYCDTEYENETSYYYDWSVPPSQCCQKKIRVK